MEAFIKFVTTEWYYAVPLFCMSLAGLTLVLWRLFLNLNTGSNLNTLLPALQDRLDKEGVEGALKYCRQQNGVIPRKLFVPALQTAKQGTGAMRRAMANAIELEILPELNFLLAPILALAKIATMVGLLFTVISMINTFTKITTESGQGVAAQGSAIGLALFATAFGLVTAIPLVFAHVLFKDWINKFETRMKSAGQKLLLMVQNAKTPAKTVVPASKTAVQAASP